MTTTARPIIFSAPMVRAILAGRKTETRRIVKLRDPTQTYSVHDDDGWPTSADEAGDWHRDRCPYGRVGDLLWVREEWRLLHINARIKGADFWAVQFTDYAILPHPQPHRDLFDPLIDDDVFVMGQTGINFGLWRSPTHMPRWASRIVLRITAIRVERLQKITEAGAIAEGATHRDFPAYIAGKFGPADGSSPMRDYSVKPPGWSMVHPVESGFCLGTARMAYANLFESINGPDSWAANPWVWVIQFAVLEGGAG